MLKQSLSHKLLQKLSPQQIQLMKLLQVPTMELEARIKEEIEENPALEEGREEKNEDTSDDDYDDREVSDAEADFDINDYLDNDLPQYKTSVNNYSADDDDKAIPLSGGKSFYEVLTNQLGLRNLSDTEKFIAAMIIGNIDEDGYLRRDLIAMVDDLAFGQNINVTEDEIEDVLFVIQDFEPAGVGARDLRECLLLQLERKHNGNISTYTAKKIIEKSFEEFTKKHYEKIKKKFEIEDNDLKDAISEIQKLNPKPGNSLKESTNSANFQQVIPDFILTEEVEGELQLALNGRNAPKLRVSKSYETMLRNYAEGAKTKKSDKDALTFVRQKLDSAKWFIDAIKQRQNTLLFTMNTILDYQKEFFLTGDETNLKPMILKDIAEIVEMDISTISRVANSKYISTPFGTYKLKYFFSESLSTTSGEEVSTREVKKILNDAVDAETKKKPLTDQKLAELLKEKGYNIARRTVAKYREQLNIPVARLRKEL